MDAVGKKRAVVLGASGVSGRALTHHLAAGGAWKVTAVSRRPPSDISGVTHLAIDLNDAGACRDAAAEHLADTTHLFYTAYTDIPGWAEQRLPNFTMLSNMVEALAGAATGLEHVCLLQGSKYYGHHLGPYRTPARENDARHMPPNFYYDQQNYLERRAAECGWTWSAARPHIICGFAVGYPLNVIAVIAAYATISKAHGLPLRFPGTPAAYRAIRQATHAGLLARSLEWMATSADCANQAFNITNGDYFRYEYMWPKIAEFFDMAVGEPQPLDLATFMPPHADLWKDIVAKYNLSVKDYAKIADWPYGNYHFRSEWDQMSDMNKARKHGFLEFVDTEEMFIGELRKFREMRAIP